MAKNHGNAIKDDEQYEALREEQGMSKEKAARIANTSRRKAGKEGGKQPRYEQWTKRQLYEKAQQVDIDGRSRMSKDELKRALRNH